MIELVAFIVNENTDEALFSLEGLKAHGDRLGDFEIEVRRSPARRR